MSKATSLLPRQVYVLRASIEDSAPSIWRKLSVPGHFTLEDLHVVLQIAFGWDNDHMHSFTIGSTEYQMRETIEMSDIFNDNDIVDECTVRLDDLLTEKQKFTYLYDFGDSWQHRIIVSKTIPVEDGMEESSAPRCLDGKRAGPPEDCGGIWGYEEMLAIAKDPSHEQHEDIYAWLGDTDPEYFDPEAVNARLEKVFGKKSRAPQSPSRKTKKPPASGL